EHENGVTGLSRIVACARRPLAFEGLLSALAGRQPEMDDSGLRVAAANATLEIETPAAMAARFRVSPDGDTELALRGIVCRVASLRKTQDVLEASGIAFTQIGGMLIVAPAAGQGAFFGFEESSA